MTENELFNLMFNGGAFTLPYLLKFTYNNTSILLVNNNKSVEFEDETYLPCGFEYSKPNPDGTGGSLSITSIDNDLFDIYESLSNASCTLTVVGVIIRGQDVQAINRFKHRYGKLTMSENRILEFNFQRDDRLDMQFCAYTLDTENNRSNA